MSWTGKVLYHIIVCCVLCLNANIDTHAHTHTHTHTHTLKRRLQGLPLLRLRMHTPITTSMAPIVLPWKLNIFSKRLIKGRKKRLWDPTKNLKILLRKSLEIWTARLVLLIRLFTHAGLLLGFELPEYHYLIHLFCGHSTQLVKYYFNIISKQKYFLTLLWTQFIPRDPIARVYPRNHGMRENMNKKLKTSPQVGKVQLVTNTNYKSTKILLNRSWWFTEIIAQDIEKK